MLYTIPDYYHEFTCTADKCEDTCCAGWQIMIDKKSLGKYRKVRGAFGRRLRRSIDWKEGAFRQSADKRCAFLNRDNLCDLYTALGKGNLCKTCRNYPRHIEEFENVREITLSVSCPAVAKILLGKTEPVRFLTYEKDGEEEFEDFDPFLYSVLADARETMFRVLQDRKKDLEWRIVLTLALARDVQKKIDRGKLFSCEELFERYERGSREETAKIDWGEKGFCKRDLEERTSGEEKRLCGLKNENVTKVKRPDYEFSKKKFHALHRLEKLREDWEPYLYETEDILFGGGKDVFDKKHMEFTEWLKENLPSWEIMLEQLMVYFVSTYFCGAVYDGKAYGKVRFAALNVFFIYEMMLARWVRNERGLEIEDIEEVVYRYSREVEHSDQNLKKMGVC